MGWREKFSGTVASFRGESFRIEDINMSFGRDLDRFYGKSEKSDEGGFGKKRKDTEPLVEDGGKLPREFDIVCFFSGNNYFVERDAFIKAIEDGNPGTLILPNHDPLTVRAGRAVNRFNSREGGFERILVTFVQTSEEAFEQPAQTVNTEKVADDAANASQSSIRAAFSMVASTFEAAAVKSDQMVEAVSSTISTVMAGGEGAPLDSILDSLDNMSNNARTLIQSPQTLALEITDTVDAITFAFTNPIDAFNSQVQLFEDYGLGLPFYPIDTPSDQDVDDNRTSMIQIVQNSALAGAGRSLAKAEFESLDDALLAKDSFDSAIREQQIANGDQEGYDDVYNSLTALQAAVAQHINDQENLPSNVILEYAAQVPTLVIAEDLYGDADRDQELVDRNAIRNPLFCKNQMSVLSE
jgi:prophage DNA circulation protein